MRTVHSNEVVKVRITSRDRPKSAPYLRLKNSKRTSECQSIGEFGWNLLWKKCWKKSHNAEKNEREDILGFFNIHSVAEPKNWRGDPLVEKNFEKKVAQCRKNGPFGLVRYCMLRGKPFWFSSLGQQVQFCVFSKFYRTFGRTILVTSGGLKKALTKIMTIVDSFCTWRSQCALQSS